MRKDGGKEVNTGKMPEFATEEQEAEYWDTHSPLDVAEPEAEDVRVRVPKDRPITIRLDSESRRKLEKLAAESGLGPSTFARLILTSAIEKGGRLPAQLDSKELAEALEQNLPQHIRKLVQSFIKPVTIDEPPILLIDKSQMKDYEQLGLLVMSMLLTKAGVEVVTPQDSEYERLKAMALKKEKVAAT